MNITQKIQQFTLPLSSVQLKTIGIFLILLLFGIGIEDSFSDGSIIWKKARNESGELGWHLLLFIIFIGLFTKISPKTKFLKQLLPLRKEAGIFVYLIISAHAIFHFLRRGVWGDFSGMIFETFQSHWVILLGAIAFLLMLPLFLTSNTFSIRKMGGKLWKRLHLLSHLIFVLASIHVAFAKYPEKQEIDVIPLVFLTLYGLGYGYIFWKTKQKNQK